MVDTAAGDEHNKPKIKNRLICEEKSLTADDYDTRCGIGCFYPQWLQIFASKKAFVVVYALAGMQQMIVGSYFVGTMSTMEKSFNMSSRQSGIISAAWDFGSLFANILITYIAAKGHRTRWVATGTLLVSVSSLMRIAPHYMFGTGDVIKMYTKEHTQSFPNSTNGFEDTGNSTALMKMSTNINCSAESNTESSITFYITLVSQMILGVGGAVYWTCGAAYLDDNVRKNIVPTMLAIVQFIRLFGPTVGFILSSYALRIYVDPSLTPVINSEDPRWIGAWWIGWYPIGLASLVIALILYLFPKSLPRAVARNQASKSTGSEPQGVSVSDFNQSMGRILKNKVIIFNSFSSVCFTMGLLAYWTFMPKYMESQFRLSPSKSSFLTGTVGILCNAVGVMAAGLIISRSKPSSRFLAGWNVLVELLDVLGHVAYAFMSCPTQKYHGHWNDEGLSWNLTETCNANLGCGTDIQFSPVCDISRDLAYYSPCHAGCNATIPVNGTLEYINCSCVPGYGKVVDGLCPSDCSSNIIMFILIMAVLSFTSATGRSANTLIQFRCVEERDKSLSIGVTETLLSLLSFIPAPILYGMLMDWTCIVWGDKCGSPANCWIYDGSRLRFGFNLTAAGFLLIGTVLDCFVWYYVKGLKLYDDDIVETELQVKTKTPIVKNNRLKQKQEIELPLMQTYSSER